MRFRWLAGSVLAAAAVVGIAACGSNASSSPPSSSNTGAAAGSGSGSSTNTVSATGIKEMNTNLGMILTTAAGQPIYWFAIDTPTTSKCSGTCLSFWPALTGTPTFASGVSLPGKLGTITRSDGTTQATYDGHPLYTYAGDKTAGKATGNGTNIDGGLWWAMTPTGAKPSTSTSNSGSGSGSGSGGGGGGYGY